MDDGQRLVSGQAWSDYCDRLKALGQRILKEDFPGATPETVSTASNIWRA